MIEPTGWITTPDGTRLCYTTLGDGPQVVCVQAGFYFEEAFAPIADGRTFVLLHQRGRGLSEMPDGAIEGVRHEIDDLEVVREALGVDRWSLIGWSYMGMVAVSYALDHPERVEQVVHLCSLGPDVASYNDEAKALERVDPADLELLNKLGAEGLMESDPVAYTKQFARVVCSMQMANREAFEAMRFDDHAQWPNEWLWRPRDAWRTSFEAWDERDRLPSLSARLLVVHGEEDLIPARAARDTAALAGNARYLEVEGSGHWPWLERPDVLLPALETFLSGGWPDAAVRV